MCSWSLWSYLFCWLFSRFVPRKYHQSRSCHIMLHSCFSLVWHSGNKKPSNVFNLSKSQMKPVLRDLYISEGSHGYKSKENRELIKKTGWHPLLTLCSWIICFVWVWITAKTLKPDFLQKEQLAFQKDAIRMETLDGFLMNRSSTVMRAPRPRFWKQFKCIYTHNGNRRKRSCPAYCFKAYSCRP